MKRTGTRRWLICGVVWLALAACTDDDDSTADAAAGRADAAFGQADAAAGPSDAALPDADGLTLDVDRDCYLDELGPDELQALCAWMVEVQGGPHTVDCGGGVSITVDPIEDCLARVDWPHCEVALMTDCIAAQAVDLCASVPPECTALYECAFGAAAKL